MSSDQDSASSPCLSLDMPLWHFCILLLPHFLPPELCMGISDTQLTAFRGSCPRGTRNPRPSEPHLLPSRLFVCHLFPLVMVSSVSVPLQVLVPLPGRGIPLTFCHHPSSKGSAGVQATPVECCLPTYCLIPPTPNAVASPLSLNP